MEETQGQAQDPGTTVQTEQIPDTQEPEQTSPTQDESGHEGDQNESSQTQAAPTEQTEGQPEESQEDLARKREEGKLQQVQRQLAEREKELERLRVIEQKALESPDKYKRALMDYNDATEEQANAEIAKLQAQGYWKQNQQAQTQPQTANINPYEAAQQVFQMEQERLRMQRTFFDKVPEMDPANVSDEQREAKKALAIAVENEARRRNPNAYGVDLVNDMVEAYKTMTGRTDEQIKAAREEGRMEGYLQANASNAGVQQSSKGITPSGSSHGLTPQELEIAKQEGYTAEEFAKLKGSEVIVE